MTTFNILVYGVMGLVAVSFGTKEEADIATSLAKLDGFSVVRLY